MGTAKRKRRASRAWSKEDIKNLRGFAKDRLSGSQAAMKLRRTPGAVAQKAMTLGIRFRSINRKRRKGVQFARVEYPCEIAPPRTSFVSTFTASVMSLGPPIEARKLRRDAGSLVRPM